MSGTEYDYPEDGLYVSADFYKLYPDKVKAFVTVEMSMGQLIEDVELATRCKKPVLLCNRAGGMIPSPEQVLAKIKEAGGNN